MQRVPNEKQSKLFRVCRIGQDRFQQLEHEQHVQRHSVARSFVPRQLRGGLALAQVAVVHGGRRAARPARSSCWVSLAPCARRSLGKHPRAVVQQPAQARHPEGRGSEGAGIPKRIGAGLLRGQEEINCIIYCALSSLIEKHSAGIAA